MCFKTQPTIPKHEFKTLRQDLTPQGRMNLFPRDANNAAYTDAMVALYDRLSPHARRILVMTLHRSLRGEE